MNTQARRKKQTKNQQRIQCDLTRTPIVYHSAINEQFHVWAASCGWTSDSLRGASEQAIRTRHHEAVIQDESHMAHGCQPDIWTLKVSSKSRVQIHYTVENHAVVIRGYSWDTLGEPLDDFDGGGFFSDNEWLVFPRTK